MKKTLVLAALCLLVIGVSSSLASFWTIRYTQASPYARTVIPANVCGAGWTMQSAAPYEPIGAEGFTEVWIACVKVGATGVSTDSKFVALDFAKTVTDNRPYCERDYGKGWWSQQGPAGRDCWPPSR
jgi:hypothetical protein